SSVDEGSVSRVRWSPRHCDPPPRPHGEHVEGEGSPADDRGRVRAAPVTGHINGRGGADLQCPSHSRIVSGNWWWSRISTACAPPLWEGNPVPDTANGSYRRGRCAGPGGHHPVAQAIVRERVRPGRRDRRQPYSWGDRALGRRRTRHLNGAPEW